MVDSISHLADIISYCVEFRLGWIRFPVSASSEVA
jgi:hypothetical protein